jgi:p-hydroxybenzoate 3-monooxygenase
MTQLTGGRRTVIYPQQKVVQDAIAARIDTGDALFFDVEDVRLEDVASDRPTIRFFHEGRERVLRCDVIAGCDGFHGVCRDAIPSNNLATWSSEYPFAWLGILADVAPSTFELIYAAHQNGFALHSLRSHEVSRFYLQVCPTTDLREWPDERVWEELQTRLATVDDWTLAEGPITKKDVTCMRSFVAEPMQYGNLFLAGDAAHIVPPTAAKGLNLAVADVCLLADGLATWFRTGCRGLLDRYSAAALRRVWRAQHFSRVMTWLLHHETDDAMDARLQRARLEEISSSEAAMTAFCENYVGLPFAGHVRRTQPDPRPSEALKPVGLSEEAMSQENVDVVHEAWDAWLSGDLDTLFARYFDRNAVYDLTHFREWPDAIYGGIEGVRRGLTEWLAVWEAWEAGVDEILAVPDGRVAVLTWQRGKGKQSGLPMEMEWAQIVTVRDGRITRVDAYDDRSKALAAVGLSGQPMSQENAEVRALMEAAFRALNADDLDGFLALVDEDVGFTSMVAEAEGTTFRGHDGVRAWWETVRGAFEDVRWELLDIQGSSERAVTNFRMTGRLGGVPVAQTMWQAATARDGRATWWGLFRTEAEAFEAVGLSE